MFVDSTLLAFLGQSPRRGLLRFSSRVPGEGIARQFMKSKPKVELPEMVSLHAAPTNLDLEDRLELASTLVC